MSFCDVSEKYTGSIFRKSDLLQVNRGKQSVCYVGWFEGVGSIRATAGLKTGRGWRKDGVEDRTGLKTGRGYSAQDAVKHAEKRPWKTLEVLGLLKSTLKTMFSAWVGASGTEHQDTGAVATFVLTNLNQRRVRKRLTETISVGCRTVKTVARN
jgi:hypothetical protein